MRTLWHDRKRGAFTLVELLVVVAIIAVLAALLLPALTRGKSRAQRVECISDLNQLGTAFQMFAHDHQGRYPMQTPFADGGSMELVQAGENINGVFYFSYRHFQTLANELVATKPLVCPADLGRDAAVNFAQLQNSNVSYFVDVNADYNLPLSILAGDRNITNNGYATASIVRGAYGLRWTSELHVFKGNILFSDTHVEELNNDNLNLSASPLASSTFFLPAVLADTAIALGPPPGGGPSTPPQGGGGQPPAPSTQASANSGSSGGGAAPSMPPMTTPNQMSGAQMVNHGNSFGTMTEVNVRGTGTVISANEPPRTQARTQDDEPEPPLLWLAGVARTGVARGGWWLTLLFLLLALYLYARWKMRAWRKDRASERRDEDV